MYITLDIDLSMLPKDRIKEGANGHKYIKLTVSTMKAPDKWGNDMTVFVSQTKEEREQRADRLFIGKGKNWPDRQPSAPKPVNDFPEDLGF